jgi:hypothetical protein
MSVDVMGLTSIQVAGSWSIYLGCCLSKYVFSAVPGRNTDDYAGKMRVIIEG